MTNITTELALLSWKSMKAFLEQDTPREALLAICQHNIDILRNLDEQTPQVSAVPIGKAGLLLRRKDKERQMLRKELACWLGLF